MHFSVFFPSLAETEPVPIIYYLSGLTCNDENVMVKSGSQRACEAHGVAFIAPDTSPRGLGIRGEDESWDFGTGAGFYLNATQEPWVKYRMYDYILSELPQVLRALKNLDVDKASIMGHSMGGHGALVLALGNPVTFKSVSAMSPICHPSKTPWGQKAFQGYLGSDEESWKVYDATERAKNNSGPQQHVLIDTGTDDEFLQVQLHPWAFEEAAAGKLDLKSNMRVGYDHSYFFVATFIDDHIEFHAKALRTREAM